MQSLTLVLHAEAEGVFFHSLVPAGALCNAALPPIHHGTSLPVLSLPCPSPKHGVQQSSRVPACFSSNEMGLQEAVVGQAGCLG